jgi:deferrochelatase/peroxidase EfeB
MSATPADTARYAENTARARRQAAAAVAPSGATRGIAAAEQTEEYEEPERGLYFICLNANISRQFEFVQSSWLNNPTFDGLYDDADPLVAPHGSHSSGGATFTVPARPIRRRVTGLPQFVTVHGGGYFFLPGVRALRYLAGLRSRS